MARAQYKTAQIILSSEWDSTKQMWRPAAVVTYIKSNKMDDQQISSEDLFSTVEEANAHAKTLAERWVDEHL